MRKTLTSKRKIPQEVTPTLENRLKIVTTSKTAKKIRIGDTITFILTIKDLAYIVNKSRVTILRYEKLGIFPPAPIRLGKSRYYRIAFCEKLFPLVDKMPSHLKPPQELLVQINILFKEEREYLNANKIKLCQ